MINRIFFAFIVMCSFFSYSNETIYVDQVHFKDESNKTFNLKQLIGKKVIISMAYTSCQGTCPMIVSRLQKIEKKLNDKGISPEVVIVTYDPDYDQPEQLIKNYREKLGIKNSNWHFLVGTDQDSRMMSMLLGIKYSRNQQSGVIIHDNKILLLDENGLIKSRLNDLNEDDSLLIK